MRSNTLIKSKVLKNKAFNSREHSVCRFRSACSLIIRRQRELRVLSTAFTLGFIILKTKYGAWKCKALKNRLCHLLFWSNEFSAGKLRSVFCCQDHFGWRMIDILLWVTSSHLTSHIYYITRQSLDKIMPRAEHANAVFSSAEDKEHHGYERGIFIWSFSHFFNIKPPVLVQEHRHTSPFQCLVTCLQWGRRKRYYARLFLSCC